MLEQKKYRLVILIILSVSFISASLTAIFLSVYNRKVQFDTLDVFCSELISMQPDAERAVLKSLKRIDQSVTSDQKGILQTFGYRYNDFGQNYAAAFLVSVVIFLIGAALLFLILTYWHRRTSYRIRMLTEYLEKVNSGDQGLLLETAEDEFSRLQDEIYKTVSVLYQMRDNALAAKSNFVDNLSNIAHQLKTPITAISLSTQMMKDKPSAEYILQIQRQLKRLTHLEEALLLLSRIDAGALSLKKTSVDVFTLLTLAADNLQELFEQEGVSTDIPEMGEVTINVDLEWTMEAVMNLFKNCLEHSPVGAVVHCSYEANPLYVQIRIWDEGKGFAKEDMPHLFDRFYRGKDAKKNSIGIGLSLAKEIIEMQNGMISASNLPTSGACFEIRFYSH